MKKVWRVRLISLLMVAALLVPSSMAFADRIKSDSYVPVYEQMNTETKLDEAVHIYEQNADLLSGGWYYVRSEFHGRNVYVRSSSVTVLDATPQPIVTPTPVPGSTTPAPGATATPEPIQGEKDPTFNGTILSYTVPTGGLSLYNEMQGSVVDVVKAGTTIKLTAKMDTATGDFTGWYSVYYNNSTRYVPDSLIKLQADGTATPPPSNVKSIQIGAGGADLYTIFNPYATNVSDRLTGKAGSLAAGWVNAKYENSFKDANNNTIEVYLYTVGSNRYYFTKDANWGTSSASVESGGDTTLMTKISVKAGTKLYLTKSTGSNYRELTSDATIYGAKADSDWYKVSYGGENFYLLSADIADKEQIAVNDTIASGAYWVTVGSKGANIYKSRAMGYVNSVYAPTGAVYQSLAAGSSVLASPYDLNWYTYTVQDGADIKTYYLYAGELADATSTNSLGSIKVFLPAGTPLYSKTTATQPTAVELPADYYVVKSYNDTWYSLTYNNLTYYVRKDMKNPSSSDEQIVIPDAGQIWLYSMSGDTYTQVHLVSGALLGGALTIRSLVPGATYPTPPQDHEWYGIVNYEGVDYLVSRKEIEDNSGTKKWTLKIPSPNQIGIYNTSTGAREGLVNGTFTVYEVKPADGYANPPAGDTWYGRISYNGTDYLITSQEVLADREIIVSDATPLANTADGKTYYVTIGAQPAQLYKNSTCSEAAAGHVLAAGEVVLATKYTDSLYTVDSGGAKYYLPVRYIASIRGGNDADASTPGSAGGSITDVVTGEKNTSFTETVFSYTIPTGGLFLYYEMNTAKRALTLNGGTTVKLNTINGVSDWYTTWYGGSQYYVPKAALTVSEEKDLSIVGTYSIVLKNAVTLYTNASCTTQDTYRNNYKTNIVLAADTRINAKVYSKNTDGSVRVYSYVHFDGKTYYFPGKEGDSANVDNTQTLLATLASNADTNLITKLTLRQNTKLYLSADTKSSSMTVAPQTLYGVRHNNDWYKVIYDDASWYMQASAVGAGDVEQISISGSATSTSYYVVIGSAGASLYTKPSTNSYQTSVYENGKYESYAAGMQNYAGKNLAAGSTVLASKYDSTWYSYAYNDDPTAPDYDPSKEGKVYYFQNNKVANANSTSAVSSYQIKLAVGVKIPLYSTVSSTASPTESAKLEGGATYVFRTIDKNWSSVVFQGRTYYIKNADIPTEALKDSTPIATTSVGKTYKITVGSSATVYPNSTLSGSALGTLAAGTQTNGTKMYVSSLSTSMGMVYAITYGGRTGYIDANLVTGVAEGDEVDEAKEAENNNSSTAIGAKVSYTFNNGSKLYTSKNTSGSTVTLGFQITLTMTKEDASWYSTVFSGATYYYPASEIEKGSGTGISIGQTVTHKLDGWTNAYAKAEDNAPSAEMIPINTVLQLKKISDKWYETTYEGKTYYIKTSEVYISTTPTNPGTTTTTDGTGIITPMVLIDPSSGSVNMRSKASLSGTILAKVPKGTQVVNNSYVVDANNKVWYNVTYAGKTGYIIGDYVKAVGTVNTSTGSDPTQDVGKTLTVNTSVVNVRSGAGASYSVLGTLEKGTAFTVTDVKLGSDGLYWYQFRLSTSTYAWIRSDYVSGGTSTIGQGTSNNVAIKSGGTNLRSGAGETFGLITKLDRDVIVTIIGTGTDASNQTWYRVTIDNLTGYVREDLVRPLTTAEQEKLLASVASQYTELRSGSKGAEVTALQQQLIALGYLAAGQADGIYGPKTTAAVKAFQAAKSLSQTGVATPAVQAALFNTTSITPGSTTTLDWFSAGYALINKNKNIQIYDINSGVTWNATYINGANHADVVPASAADATKLKANNITGSYVRRPVIVTIAGQKFAGSMYAVGHGSTNHVSYFSGVMCIHFTGSKTHGSDNVDADHQAAIQTALNYANSGK